MAIYYIRTDGDDSNDGLGYTASGGAHNAFKTLARAIAVVAAGDTVRIAPGTYHETMTLATAGGASTIITWWGDKESQYFLDLKPGPVRITGCDTVTGIGSAIRVIDTNAKSNNNFYNLVIDGTTSLATSYGMYTVNATINIYDCVINGGTYGVYTTATYRTSLYRCILYGSSFSAQFCYSYNCLSLAGGFTGAGVAYSCIAIGGYRGFYNIPCYNCTSFSTQYGFQVSAAVYQTMYNCTAISCNAAAFAAGTLSTNKIDLVNCKAISCGAILLNANNAGYKTNLNSVRYSNCASIATAGTYEGTPTETKFEGYNDILRLLKLATVLKFDIFENDWSTDNHLLTVTGSSASNDYISAGTYNSQILYQSIYKNYLIFNSTTKAPNNWLVQANTGATPDETVVNYASATTLIGTYTNVGTWTGTTIISNYVPMAFDLDYDILRNPRRMGSGATLDCGAYEYSNVEMEWNIYKNSAPAIRITQAGIKNIVTTAKKGIEKTAQVWVYFSGSTLKPQLIINSSENILSTTGTTVTASGLENTWELLTAKITPIADGTLTINFYCRETALNTYAIFSNFKLN